MREFNLEMLHFGEIQTLRYIILMPTVQITVLFWPFGFDLFHKISISAFQKCSGLQCFDRWIIHRINFIFEYVNQGKFRF